MRNVLLCLGAGLLLAATGCASTPPASSHASMGACAAIDCLKMQQVDRAARGRGLDVIWVNPPQKRVASPASS